MMLGESLRKYRKKENLSQEQLAQRLHVSRQAIAKWERGAGLPDVENLIGLSRLTGASIDELLGLTDARAAEAPEQSTRPQNVPASAASAAPEQPVPLRDAPASTRDAVPLRFRCAGLFGRGVLLGRRGAGQSCGGVGGPDARFSAHVEFRHGDCVAGRGIPVRQDLQPVSEIKRAVGAPPVKRAALQRLL